MSKHRHVVRVRGGYIVKDHPKKAIGKRLKGSLERHAGPPRRPAPSPRAPAWLD